MPSLEETFWIDMSTVPMIVDMMTNGIGADADKFRELEDLFSRRADEIDAKITRSIGHQINPASFKQVAALLFDELGIKSIKKTRGGDEATGDKILAQLTGKHPVVQLIRDYRAYKKLETTYARPMPDFIRSDGRIHANARITRANTGRLAFAEPNIMAVPVRSEDGRQVRNAYVAREGCYITSSDYSQVELRILAVISQDHAMLEIFRKGQDPHLMTACDVFGLPPSQIDDYKHRHPCKRVNFGIPYGVQPEGLHATLLSEGADPELWTIKACKDLIAAWYEARPGVKRYISEIHAFARRNGYVRDMWGRIKRVPQVWMADEYKKAAALREAQNMPIQSGAQGVIKKAMGKLVPIYRDWIKEGKVYGDPGLFHIPSYGPLLQIHDDIMAEIREDYLDMCLTVQRNVMENVVDLGLPLEVDPKYGKRWGELQKWKPYKGKGE